MNRWTDVHRYTLKVQQNSTAIHTDTGIINTSSGTGTGIEGRTSSNLRSIGSSDSSELSKQFQQFDLRSWNCPNCHAPVPERGIDGMARRDFGDNPKAENVFLLDHNTDTWQSSNCSWPSYLLVPDLKRAFKNSRVPVLELELVFKCAHR